MTLRKCPRAPAFEDVVGMDPNAWWLLRAGRRSLLPDESQRIPFALTLEDEEAVDAFQALRTDRVKAPARPHLFDPALRCGEETRPPPGRPLAALAGEPFFHALTSEDEPFVRFRRARKRIRISAALNPRAVAGDPQTPLLPPPVAKPPSGSVIMAVIDDGLPVFHERFRSAPCESRVHYFWQMEGAAAGGAPTVASGREWWKESAHNIPGLDELLRRAESERVVDAEDWLYRTAGMVSAVDDQLGLVSLRASHGAHVLDAAAGEPLARGVLTRPIIAVQLPPQVVADASGAHLETHVIAALEYIRDRARRLSQEAGETLRVVLNISYGIIAGPHDGRLQVEELFAQAAAEADPPICITLASGNAHLSRCHATVPPPQPPANEPRTELALRIPPDDRTPSSAELWMPPVVGPGGDARARVRLTEPGGVSTHWIREGAQGEDAGSALVRVGVPDENGDPVEVAALRWAGGASPGRGAFLLRFQPTARPPLDPEALAVAPSGRWRIEVELLDPGDGTAPIGPADPIRAWIQRDDRIPGYERSGRQARFEDPRHPDLTWAEYVHTDRPPLDALPGARIPPQSPVRRENLVNAIATGDGVVVVGAYHRADWRAAPYSSGAEGLGAVPELPDCVGEAATSLAHPGLLQAGTRSGSVVAMTGTSVSAPRAARLAADLAAHGFPCDRYAFRLLAFLHEVFMVPADAPALPPKRSGGGRLPRGNDPHPPRLDAR